MGDAAAVTTARSDQAVNFIDRWRRGDMQTANINSDNNASVESNSAGQELRNALSTSLPSFYWSAYRLLGNSADAEDAVQDAMLAACKHLGQFKGQSRMSTWLTAIVNNSARMQLRTRLRHIHVSLDEPIGDDADQSLLDRLADRAPSPEEKCGDSELNCYLSDWTTELSPTLLRAFQLRHIEGLSIRETARILGVPSGTVKARLARARKKLKLLVERTLTPRSRKAAYPWRQDFAA
jgi:RNA polymerase sigma-70 factor, ECF subfamily